MTADNSASIHFVSKDKAKLYKQPEWKTHKPCIVCGELFLPYQKRSVVCSQDCRLVHVANNSRAKWQTKDYPEINCRICNTAFKPRQRNSKYCSRKCSSNKPKYRIVICIQCKDEIKRFSHRSRDAGLCCSRECGFKWQAFIKSEIRALRRIAENNKPKPIVDAHVVGEIMAVKQIARRARASRLCKHCGEIVYSKYVSVHPTCRKEYVSFKKEQYKQTDSYKQTKKAAKSRRKALERGARFADPIKPDFILERDKYRCYICGIKTPKNLRGTCEDNAPEIDHIIPLSKGGLHVESNLRCACRKCNGAKSDSVYQLI